MRASVTLVIVALSFIGTPSLPAQMVRGLIRDSTEQPIADVYVNLMDSTGKFVRGTRTDTSGRFQVLAPRLGTYTIWARRLGYYPTVPRMAEVSTGPNQTDLSLVMRPIPRNLERVVISAERDSIRNTRLFGMSLRAVGATIITPSEIDNALHGASDVNEMIGRQGIVGLVVDYQRHCVTRGYSTCLPVILDGLLITDPSSLMDILPPQAVDYIVFVRPNEMGVLYGSVVGDLGALVVVTKRGPRRGPQ